MNDNAKAWVKALRSGDYKQGRGRLRDGKFFCCLGVACDLAIKAGVVSERGRPFRWDKFNSDERVQGDECVTDGNLEHRRLGSLPRPIADWLGLRTQSGDFSGDRSLVSINDHLSHPDVFKMIADIIESEPEKLFA